MTDTTECWLPIRDFEGYYEVSSLGQVRSLDRIVMSRNRWGPIAKHLRGKTLAQRTDGYGYRVVTLSRDGKKPRPYRVHRLVGEAFFGPQPPGADTRHGPAGMLANAATDLCYGSRAENELDKIRDGASGYAGGMVVAGEGHWNAKLTARLVVEIRQHHAGGQSRAALARTFGVSPANISKIVRGETWADPHYQDPKRDITSLDRKRDGNARLTLAIAEDIRRRYKAGERQVALAARYGVTQPCISQIVLGKTWVA